MFGGRGGGRRSRDAANLLQGTQDGPPQPRILQPEVERPCPHSHTILLLRGTPQLGASPGVRGDATNLALSR